MGRFGGIARLWARLSASRINCADDRFNHSNLATVIILPLTSNRKFESLPGNVFLPKEQSGLAKDSVINVTQLAAIDKAWIEELVTELPRHIMSEIDRSLSLVLGL